MGGDETVVLEPRLDACIETQAKREYNRTLAAVTGGDETLTGRLETLRLFLQNEDFNKLRAGYEPLLAGGRRVTFTIRTVGGKPAYDIEAV